MVNTHVMKISAGLHYLYVKFHHNQIPYELCQSIWDTPHMNEATKRDVADGKQWRFLPISA